MLGTVIGAKISYPFMRLWAAAFVFPIAGIRFKVQGRENIPKNEACIYIANHNSLLDTPALIWSIPFPIQPLGKVEMTKIPIFGFLYRYMVVLVDRSSLSSRKASMLTLKDRLNKGISVLVFPEGTMNKGSEPLQPFYNGAFHLALETGASLVPVVVTNSRNLLPPSRKMVLSPGTINVHILKPIQTKGRPSTHLGLLRNEAQQIMMNTLSTTFPKL